MKLSSIVIATLVAGLAEAKKPSGLDAKLIQKGMNNVNTKTLLRRARKLDQDAEFEITSDYSIKFNSCTSLNVLDTDEVDTYVSNAQSSGSSWDLSSLQMYKDYVIFDATSSSSGSTVQYVIDLATFASTLVEAVPSQLEEYCNACEEAYDNCYPGDDDQAQGNNNGGRKLKSGVEYIDCDTCEANGCFFDEENGQEYAMYTDSYGFSSNDALEWFGQVSECQEISNDNGYYNYYYNAYAGLTCNTAGTGVEIGVFTNEECTITNTQTTFYNLMQNEARILSYVDMTKNLVEKAFTQSVSCQSVEYASPYNNDNNDNNDNNNNDNNDNNDNNYEANELCQQLMEDESAFDISQSCDEDGNNNDNNDNNNNNNNQYDEDGNAWGTYTYGNYGTISYDINDVEDVGQVCTAIQSKQGSYSTVGVSSSNLIYDYSSSSSSNTYTWGLANGSSNANTNSQTAAPTSGNTSNSTGFDWEGTKQQVGDTYNSVSDKVGETYGTVSEKVGSGITRASEETGLAVEEVVGIVLGALAGLCLFMMCGCYCCCKREEDPKQVQLIASSPRERKQWTAKDNWNTTRDRSTWA